MYRMRRRRQGIATLAPSVARTNVSVLRGMFLKRTEGVVTYERWIRAAVRGLLVSAVASAPLAAQAVDTMAFAGMRWREVEIGRAHV